MDETLLHSLGLSKSELKLYRWILEAGPVSPAELAKKAGVKRTTAYSTARSLVEKGLVSEDNTRRPRTFAPATAKEIDVVVALEKKRSEERQQAFRKIGEQMSLLQSEKAYPVPQIKFVEEEKIDTFLRQAFASWNQSMVEIGELGFWGFQDASLVKNFEGQLHYWWEVAPEGVYTRLLTNLSDAEKGVSGKYERRDVKYWGEAANFHSTTWVTGDYVVMINTRQRPFYLIEIHSRLFAHDQREVFKNLWPLV